MKFIRTAIPSHGPLGRVKGRCRFNLPHMLLSTRYRTQNVSWVRWDGWGRSDEELLCPGKEVG